MLSEQLKEAGWPVDRDKLYVAASECLQAAKLKVDIAASALRIRALRDPDLLTELARFYLHRVIVPDMSSGSNASGGHTRDEAQHEDAPVTSAQADGGQCKDDAHRDSAADSFREGQSGYANRNLIAPTDARGSGHSTSDAHNHDARPRANPIDPKVRLAANLGVTISLLDTFRERYSIDLRKVQVHELPKLAKKHAVIARFMEVAHRHSPKADPFALVPDAFKNADIELFIQQAERGNENG